MPSQSKIHVAIVGVGLVGSELVNQILAIPQQTSPFNLISLSNSTRTLFDQTNPIKPGSNWKSALAESQNKADLGTLTRQLSELVAQNKRVAVVDNTSSDHVAALYPEWLRKGFNVVTPNKKAFSGELSLFEDILKSSKESGARFLYEATVGAGLPVINTLKEIVASGDKECYFIKIGTHWC
jgi:homoserine dehydrogenase